MGKIKDLSNLKLENGTIVENFVEIRNHAAYWKCKCFCGSEFIARGADLTNGHTKSCGCLLKEKIKEIGKANANRYKKDLVNQHFGNLTVLYDTGKRDSCRSVIWMCQCNCGNKKEISSHSLRGGITSCGCIKSKGELKIGQLLIENNIPFETQKIFNNCCFPNSGAYAKFDFFVDNQYIIEFDGIQHFDSRYGWNTEDKLNNIQERDNYKNLWCKENNIPIIRIPYTHYEQLCLNDLLLETTSFLL